MSSPGTIVGHEKQIAFLLRDVEAGNVAHAYLFTGRPHVGKFTVAKWFARTLLLRGLSGAERTRAEGQIDRLLHPDLLVIDRLWQEEVCEDMDIIAKTSNVSQQHRVQNGAKTDTIGIDDIRALQVRLREVGTGQFRCCCIRDVSRMNDEAVNALLKLLEEPPEGMVFLCTAPSTQALFATLVSRARIVRFSPVPARALRPLLSGVDDDDAGFLLRRAQGAPGIVTALRRDPDLLRRERQAAAQAAAFWESSSYGQRLRILAPVAERSSEADAFLLHLGLQLRADRRHFTARRADAFQDLVSGLETNVSRPLLLQRFALSVHDHQ